MADNETPKQEAPKQEMPDEAIIYTEKEAAAILKMTPRMLANRRRAGKIKHVKDGGYVMFTGQQVREYLHSHEWPGGEAAERSRSKNDLLLVSLGGRSAKSVIADLLEQANRKGPAPTQSARTRSPKSETP